MTNRDILTYLTEVKEGKKLFDIDYIINNIKNDLIKKEYKPGERKAFSTICNIATKAPREDIKGIFYKDGFAYVCNGYILIRVKEDKFNFDSLPIMSLNLTALIDYNYNSNITREDIKLPNAEEVKIFIKEKEIKKELVPLDVGYKYDINPKMLKQVYDIIGDNCRTTVYNANFYFENDEYNILLLGVRKGKTNKISG